ncbi:MAG TPA: NHL repeat-containing protein [Candidatus Tumulicola sp.]
MNYRPFGVRLTATLILAGCFTLAGCGGPGPSSPVPASADHVAHSGAGRSGSAQTLYVASESGVAAFNTASYALERTYGASQGVNYPQALAEDTAGNLYVANPIDNDVVEFAAGTTTTLQTLSKGMHGPYALVFDPSGNLYVLNGGATAQGPNVAVYSPDGSLLRTITHGLSNPVSLAFDSSGNLYVANQGTDNVTVYNGGLNKVSRTLASGFPNSILVDKSDDVYVVGCGIKCVEGRITEYAPHSKTIVRTITKELRDPRQIALDSNGNLFVAQANAGDVKTPCRVTVYAKGQTQPYEKITDGVHGATWVAIDASDNLYVMNSINHCYGNKTGNIPVYPAGTTMFVHRFAKPILHPVQLLIGS